MGQQTQVFSGSVREEKEQSAVRWGIFMLAIGLIALLVLAVLTVRLTGKPVLLPVDEESHFASNPELMLARRCTGPAVGNVDTAYLAANPELMLARRCTGPAAGLVDTAYLAANPELVVARRYAASVAWDSDSNLLAANPELMIFRRYRSTFLQNTRTLSPGSSQ